jgi:hypothetical protein
MSDKNKENSVVFSNKELKEVANTPAPKPIAPRKRASFIDDAGSILSDIKSAIGDEVAEELQRFEDERRSAAAAVLQREEALQEARRAEIQARRAAEEARRQAAAEEREMLLNRLQDGPETASEPDGTPDKAFDQAHVSQQFSEPAAPKKSKAPMIASIAAIVLIGAGYVATSSNSEKAQPAAMPTTAVSAPATTPAVPPTGTPATPTAKSQPSPPGAALGAVGASDAGLSALSDGGKAKPTDTKASDAGAKKAPKASKKKKKKRKRARKKKRKRKKKKRKPKKKKYEINLDDID